MDTQDMIEHLGEVLVIIPTYNERINVETITRRVRDAVPAAHVLVVDDNSPDGTGHVADRLADEDSNVHVLHRPGKQGLAAAYLAGFRWGLERDFGVIVQHDADGSHQPEQLPRLLRALLTADLVKGSRWIPSGSVVNWPWHRELLSRGASLWVRFWLGIPVKDATGGFNAFRAETLRGIDLDSVESSGYVFQVDLTWRALRNGYVVAEVPIEFVEREHGVSKMRGSIVSEAVIRTALWGLKHRGAQARRALGSR